MAGEVTVDALPYVDTGYDEAGVREVSILFRMTILVDSTLDWARCPSFPLQKKFHLTEIRVKIILY